ncbi:MAG: hypothetical protein WA210_15810 [Burkholderiaceae bacterium]
MTTTAGGSPLWSSSKTGAAALAAPEAWHATNAQTSLTTQIQRDKDEYLSGEKVEIGRITAPNERELFVSCDAGPALQQQFELACPEFIVVHDIGTTSSRKLLRGLAAASGRVLQKLVIRRQGYGQALATLSFIELPASNGQTLRMYTTQAETDPPTRKSLARMLLAFSRLGVVMVGDVSAQALQPVLNTLRDDIATGPWHNRHLLMLPLASASNVFAQATDLADRTGVRIRTTPVVSRPAEAWSYISDTWRRLNGPDAQEPASAAPNGASLIPELAVDRPSAALPWSGSAFSATASGYPSVAPRSNGHEQDVPTRPAALLRPAMTSVTDAPGGAATPSTSGALTGAPATDSISAAEIRAGAPTVQMGLSESMRPEHVPQLTLHSLAGEQGMLQRYVRLLSALNGMRACCIFDLVTGARLVHSSGSVSATELGRQGQLLMAAMLAAGKALGSGQALPEAAITLETHHLLLRGVPNHPQVALHAVFEKASTNLTLARLQVMRLDALFEDPPRGA